MAAETRSDQAPRSARRSPRQVRSQARVERILTAAATLIGERGSDRVTVSDIARASGVAMGSLYAYFDGKPAIIAALAQAMIGDQSAALDASLTHATAVDDVIARLGQALDSYYRLARDNPVWQDIWVGLQADKELQRIDREDSLRNGERLVAHFARFVAEERLNRLRPSTTLIMHLSGAAVRFAAALDSEAGDALIAAFQAMAAAELARLAGSTN